MGCPELDTRPLVGFFLGGIAASAMVSTTVIGALIGTPFALYAHAVKPLTTGAEIGAVVGAALVLAVGAWTGIGATLFFRDWRSGAMAR